MDPRLCFPIMAAGAAVMGAGASVRHIQIGTDRSEGRARAGDRRHPAVLVAAFIVKTHADRHAALAGHRRRPLCRGGDVPRGGTGRREHQAGRGDGARYGLSRRRNRCRRPAIVRATGIQEASHAVHSVVADRHSTPDHSPAGPLYAPFLICAQPPATCCRPRHAKPLHSPQTPRYQARQSHRASVRSGVAGCRSRHRESSVTKGMMATKARSAEVPNRGRPAVTGFAAATS